MQTQTEVTLQRQIGQELYDATNGKYCSALSIYKASQYNFLTEQEKSVLNNLLQNELNCVLGANFQLRDIAIKILTNS